MKNKKFWNFLNNLPDEETVLRFDGPIAEESWFGDKITPALFLSRTTKPSWRLNRLDQQSWW